MNIERNGRARRNDIHETPNICETHKKFVKHKICETHEAFDSHSFNLAIGDTYSVPMSPVLTKHKNNPELLIRLMGKLSPWPRVFIPTSVSQSKCVF